jgi:hypothetical protein
MPDERMPDARMPDEPHEPAEAPPPETEIVTGKTLARRALAASSACGSCASRSRRHARATGPSTSRSRRSSGTRRSAAAALLFSMHLTGRLIVTSTVLNATIARRAAAAGSE